MTNMPEQIWASTQTPLAQSKSGTWNEYPYGTGYVREDLHTAAIAERDALRAELASGSFYKESDIDAMQNQITTLRAQVERLRATVVFFEGFGCPLCGGDCYSANPPVIFCPMQEARAILGDSKP